MKKNFLVAACATDLNIGTDKQIVLIPEGTFNGIDGRPNDAPFWKLTAENGRKIVQALNNRNIKTVIDYEHGTLKAQKTGQPAPASGWIKSFEYIDGIGICSSDYQWTAKAQNFIEAEEYKYLSPVFTYTAMGDITGLLCIALTNTPNLDELPALIAAASQDFLCPQKEDYLMNEFVKLMLKKLGLAETATEEEVLTAANSFFAKFDAAGFGTELAKDQTFEAALTNTIAAKVAANNQMPNPAEYVPISVVNQLQQQVADLTKSANKSEIDTLYTAACSDGRLLGDDMKKWGRQLADSNPDEFKKFVANAPKVPALNAKQTDTIAANHQQQPQLQDQLKDEVFSMLGVDQTIIEKYGDK